MRVLTVPMDDGACGYFRILEPTRIAASIGVDVRAKAAELQVVAEEDPYTKAVTVLEFREDCDVLVLQRPLAQNVHAIALAAKRQGIAVVVELDDDLHAVHTRNSMALAVHGPRDPHPAVDYLFGKSVNKVQSIPLHNRDWVTETVKLADLLIVSTPALAKYAPEKAVVVRNRLPEACLALRPDVSPTRGSVGWTGALNVHPQDMQATQGALQKIRGQFTVVGSEIGVADALRIPPQRVTLGAPWQEDIPAYWKVVPENIGVGIAPLEQSAFNISKSALKPQELATLGIPFVASPTPEYQWFVKESGAGFIARDRAEWATHLKRLLNHDPTYESCRQNGLEWAEQHSMERHVGEWITCWKRAYDKARGKVTA